MRLFILPAAFFAMNLVVLPSSFARPPSTTVDPDIARWYQHLQQPQTGLSCCNIADCRPTDLRTDPKDGTRWQALISKEIFGADAPDTWIDIPPDHILPQHDNPTGNVVICWYNHQIYCAVMPSLT